MPEIELAETRYSPGERIKGRLVIPRTDQSQTMRGLTVRVVHRDFSSRSGTYRSDVVDTFTITSSYQESIDFSLELPLSAQAGFQGKFGSADWVVTASVDVPGIDLKAIEQPLIVLPEPSEPLTQIQAQEQAADLARQTKASKRKGRFLPFFLASVFLGVGLFALITSIVALADDPTGSDALYLLLFAIIGGFFTFAGLWGFSVMFPRGDKHISIELQAATAKMGETVHVTVAVTKPGLVVGFVGVERYAVDNKLKKGLTVLYYDDVFHEEWRAIEPGSTELSFVVPNESFATYGGTAVNIDWHIAVAPTDKRETHALPASNLSRVVVLH